MFKLTLILELWATIVEIFDLNTANKIYTCVGFLQTKHVSQLVVSVSRQLLGKFWTMIFLFFSLTVMWNFSSLFFHILKLFSLPRNRLHKQSYHHQFSSFFSAFNHFEESFKLSSIFENFLLIIYLALFRYIYTHTWLLHNLSPSLENISLSVRCVWKVSRVHSPGVLY